MLEVYSFDTEAAIGLSLDLLFRRVGQMINAIMAARVTAHAVETPATTAFETLCLVECNGGLVNAIGGPPAHSQYPTLFWKAFPADGEYAHRRVAFLDDARITHH